MRRLLLILVAAASCLCPAAASAQPAAGDSVTGTLIDQFVTGVSVFPPLDVHSGPAGENPTGTGAWHIGGGLGPTWNVDVTCLAVDGKTAVFGFSGTLFQPGSRPVAGLARATDGGGPGSGLDSFEWAQVTGPDGGPAIPGPTDCSSYPAGFQPQGPTAFNRTAGDIVIIDTPAVPTSKDQCKNGGWRNFGSAFKNEGACVSFVATGGKKPPAGDGGAP
jgi:hypothetical protein